MSTELVDLHDCIRDGDHVKIVADVVETRKGKSVHIVAHGPRCKEYPKEPLITRIGML